jgi:hypothetical protein
LSAGAIRVERKVTGGRVVIGSGVVSERTFADCRVVAAGGVAIERRVTSAVL